ncbi:MAG: hypothetical protein KatS3mg052_0942 [Candidatus Roseilinea sp.]|nr:MAG: hypothetical protein KatS3mg052_0942 [Candidatus Roseilinea sp.]
MLSCGVLVKRVLRKYGYPPDKREKSDADGAGAGRGPVRRMGDRMNGESNNSMQQTARCAAHLKITQRVVLANFQFAKMAMVEDLKRNGDTIASSVIVADGAARRQ